MLSKGSERALIKAETNEDNLSLAETASHTSSDVVLIKAASALHHQKPLSAEDQCDACRFCNDSCGNPDCLECCDDSIGSQECSSKSCQYDRNRVRTFTPCQVRRHASAQSAWLVAGRDIYDATAYLQQHQHPGGAESILRRAGGQVDCSRDLKFHSRAGANTWKKYHIGVLRECNGRNCSRYSASHRAQESSKPWWLFWAQ